MNEEQGLGPHKHQEEFKKNPADRTQYHEWGRLIFGILCVALGGWWASQDLKETLNDRREILEVTQALDGNLTTTFQVTSSTYAQQNRELTGLITFTNEALTGVTVDRIVLEIFRVTPSEEIDVRLNQDQRFEQLLSNRRRLEAEIELYEYAVAGGKVGGIGGVPEAIEGRKSLNRQLQELVQQIQAFGPRESKVYFLGKCAPEHSKFFKIQSIDLGENFPVEAKSNKGYSFRMLEFRQVENAVAKEWIKYDIVIDYHTESGAMKRVAASVFTGDSTAEMPVVTCYPVSP